MKQSFSKEERLCSHRLISTLFAKGQTFHLKPFRITWIRLTLETSQPAQVLMSVPKYNFHKAVDRNLIRRRMREAYRLNKQPAYDHLSSTGPSDCFLHYLHCQRNNGLRPYCSKNNFTFTPFN
jgi:ribonuclease P protein component